MSAFNQPYFETSLLGENVKNTLVKIRPKFKMLVGLLYLINFLLFKNFKIIQIGEKQPNLVTLAIVLISIPLKSHGEPSQLIGLVMERKPFGIVRVLSSSSSNDTTDRLPKYHATYTLNNVTNHVDIYYKILYKT
jgi:hypothetical protein